MLNAKKSRCSSDLQPRSEKAVYKVFLILVIIAAGFTNLYAQSGKVDIKLKQPPPNQLGVGDMWNLELTNTNDKDIKIFLTGTATEEKDGLIIEGKSKVFTLKPGRSTYKYNDFSGAEVKYNNGKYKEIILRTGNAPEGSYTICVTAFDESGTEVGREYCIMQTVTQLGSITLLTPGDGQELDLQMPIMFSWIPLPKGGPYSLKIVELKGDQSPDVAIKESRPILDKEGIKATNYQFGISEPKLEEGKKYAWLVTSGDVKSDVLAFSMKSQETGNVTSNSDCDSCGNGPIWYFGNKAGLKFNNDGTVTPLSNPVMNTGEGCAIISDNSGIIKFYTDGITVWNAQNSVMDEGEDLNGHSSTTNSAFIVPWPGNCDKYYIFTAGYQTDGINGPGLQYSIVDMSFNGGLGRVILKNQQLLRPSSEKIAAIKQTNGDYWLIAHGAGPVNGGNFYIYSITSSGLNLTPNEIPIGYTHNGGLGFMGGQMKISPDGKKIALVVYHEPIVQVFDFDNINGSINNLLLTLNGGDRLYGLEFSPNSKLLYVSRVRQNFNSIYRISLNSFNPGANITDLTTPQPGIDRIFNLDPSALEHIGALQLAPNGVIYVAKYPWEQNPENGKYLGQITDPNSITSTYEDNGPDLLPNTRSGLGLPGTIICPTETQITESDCDSCGNGPICHSSAFIKIQLRCCVL